MKINQSSNFQQTDPNQSFSGNLPHSKIDLVDALQKVTKMIQNEKEGDHYGRENEQDELFMSFSHQKHEPSVLGNIKQIARQLLELQEQAQYSQNNPQKIKKGLSLEDSNRLVERLYQKDRKAKDKIEAQKMQKMLKIEQDTQDINNNKPITRDNSHKILQGMKTKQFIERQEDKQNQRDERVKAQRQMQEQEKQIQEDKIQRNSKLQQPTSSLRSQQQFDKDNDDWMIKRQKNKQKIHFECLAKESESLTFKPKINQNSISLIQKKMKYPNEGEHLLNLHQGQKSNRSATPQRDFPDFTPRINQKSRMIVDKSQKKLNISNNKLTNHRTKSQIGSRNGSTFFMI